MFQEIKESYLEERQSVNCCITYFSSGFQESGSGASFGSGEKYRSMLILPLSPRIHNFGSVLGTLPKLML